MKEASKILIVDDDLAPEQKEPNGNYMWYYTQALRDAGHTVVEVVGPDSAIEVLSSTANSIDLVVLDIMMPPGRAYREDDTLNGLRTGVFLAKTVQSRYPDLPILVLTNVQNPETLSQLREMPSIRKVLYKPDCTPFDLVDEIKNLWET
jgi:CheY-like chemotaxis protein